jgi:hypothetical protein
MTPKQRDIAIFLPALLLFAYVFWRAIAYHSEFELANDCQAKKGFDDTTCLKLVQEGKYP